MDVRTVQDLSAAARGRRHALGLAQLAVAERAGVSRAWLIDFEAGKPTVEMGRVLAVLAVLGLTLTVTDGSAVPPVPLPPVPADDLDALIEAYDRDDA